MNQSETFPAERQWYRDAIIYQMHVRAFHDSNGDGVGDFRGLSEKLEYIQQLGATAVWLLPFFPSPLRDDGYDIADYTNVNPTYGTLDDFKEFLQEAHRRGLRVITEMVMNHTSDQHEWFQKSRRAAPGSKWRNFYVWNDNDKLYSEARIIFQDFEVSNWTRDTEADAYYWHRFYSHQPDLNFDNPEVRQAMFDAIDFWFDMGVDGVRLDAVPYLFEREGTNCENLPETHQFLKELRAHVDGKYQDRMLLAEANQWPEDAVAYFGNDDECHMNFHFPLMPRLFMGLEREDRFPIIDILDQTPALPGNCQWAIFLRNHDELTLEMVTDEERDYMYRVYADDPQARINLGIRRRLAPLLKNNRRKIELMTALLMSLPGTPVIYYGDEIGMGDNIYLGDRDSVRTPMQWNADRNAGFSKANPQRLYLPVIIDSEYHFTARNVETEQNSPDSLLWWMRRVINLRKQYTAFGRGELHILEGDNPKVLAFLRENESETMLVVANLSRFSQCVELDLSAYRGRMPIELFGRAQFPPIGELPYFLTLGPHAFYWFRLEWAASERVAESPESLPSIALGAALDDLFSNSVAKGKLERALPDFLKRHRWYAGKARVIRAAAVIDAVAIEGLNPTEPMWLTLIEVQYTEGEEDTYCVLVVAAAKTRADNIVGDHPAAGIAQLTLSSGEGRVLCDASWEAEVWNWLAAVIAGPARHKGVEGTLQGVQSGAFHQFDAAAIAGGPPSIHGGQQSNTSAILARHAILKLYRRVNEGVNPEWEMCRFLTEQQPVENVPNVGGQIEYRGPQGQSITLAVLHEFVANEGDAWTYTLDELGRFLERVATVERNGTEELAPDDLTLLEASRRSPPAAMQETNGSYLQSARLLGQRTAELHLALAQGTGEAFEPEPFTKLSQRSLYQSLRLQARSSLALVRRQMASLPEDMRPAAEQAAGLEQEVLRRFQEVIDHKISGHRTRIHGDYHLGQVLYTGKDFIIIDFEGEPIRALSERRIKASPLRDVAGMIRSFRYASRAACDEEMVGTHPLGISQEEIDVWLQGWYLWTSAAFLKSYFETVGEAPFLPRDRNELRILFDCFLLQKTLYELSYELNNRPDWVRTPLYDLLELVGQPEKPLGGCPS